MKIDRSDVFFFAGYTALCIGIWMFSPAWSLIIGGSVLLLVGLFGAMSKAGRVRK